MTEPPALLGEASVTDLLKVPLLAQPSARTSTVVFLLSKAHTGKRLTPRGIHGLAIMYLSPEAKNPPQQTVKHKGKAAS